MWNGEQGVSLHLVIVVENELNSSALELLLFHWVLPKDSGLQKVN